MSAPIYVAVGAQVASTGATQNVAWPGSHQIGDLGIVVIETTGNGVTLTPPSGWTAVSGTPVVDVATTAGSKLHVWYRFADSTTMGTVATGAATDHLVARMYTFRDVSQSAPFNVTTTGTKSVGTANTTVTWPSVTTTINDTLVVHIAGRPNDSASTTTFGTYTAGSLDAALVEAAEAGSNSGNGGGFTLAYATKTTAGSTGTPTAVGPSTTTLTYVVFALRTKSFTLTADTVTFNETLQPANLGVGRDITADSEPYSFIGNDATLTKTSAARTLVADTATFTEDLKPANLKIGRKVTADCYTDVTLFTDNFNVGTANTPLTGYTQQGDNDIVYTGTGTIKQNGNNRAVAYRPDIPYNANQWAEITIAKLDTSFNCGVALRVQTSSSKPTEKTYHFTTNDATSAPGFSLSVYDNSSALTDLAFFSAQPAVGDRLRFEAVGNVLSGYVNGKLVIRLTNNIWSSGQAGIKGAGVVWESDDFASGNYGGLHFDALPATTKVSRRLVCASASYTLSLKDATLTKTTTARTLTADTQTYVEDLKPANLVYGREQISGGSVYRIKTEINGPALFTDTITQPNGTILGDTAEWDRWDTDNADTVNSNGSNAFITTVNRTGVGVVVASTTFGPDQWAEHTHQANASGRWTAGPLVRATSGLTTNGYSFITTGTNGLTNPSDFRIVKYVNGTLTTLATSGPEGFGPVANSGTYTMRLEVIGDMLYGYIDDKLIVTARDSSLTSGQPGFQIIYGGSTISFSAGQIEASTTGLKASRTLSCDSATYTEDLQPANLIAARSLTAKVYADEQLFSDNFTGAAGLLGSNYTQQGDVNLRLDGLGNVHSLANGRSLAWPNTVSFENNQYAEITLTEISYAASAGSGLVLRVQTNESPGVEKSYIFRTGNAGAEYALAKYNETSGVVTLRTASRIPQVGDRLRAVASGNTLYFYVNDQLIATNSDISWPGGVPGIYGFNQQWKSDNFVAGNYGGLHLAGTYTNTRAARRLVCASASYTLELKDAALIKRTLIVATGFFGLTTNSFSNIFTDNFNRADSSSLGANWQVNQNTFRIVSNEVRGSTTYNQVSLANVVSGTYNSNQFAQIDVIDGAGDINGFDVIGPGVRVNGKAGYYLTVLRGNTLNISILKVDSSGVPISLLDKSLEIAASIVTAKLSVTGNKLSAYLNNDLVATVIDNTYSSGVPGLYYRNFLTGVTSADNFIAGNTVDNASLKVSRTLFCASASYTLSLKDATLTKTTTARTLLAETATYNENLQPANLKVGKRLAADTQSYNEDLKPANLRVTRRLVAEQQTYNEDLKPANLKVGKRLVADTQSYNEDLKPANLKVGKTLVADRRIYSISTSETTFRLGRRIIADKQTYVLTGIVASFKTAGSLIADVRSYTLTGNPAGTLRFAKLSAAATSYTFNGNPANLARGKKLVADTASYNETLRDATLRVTRKVTADTRSYSFSGQAANLAKGFKLSADTRTYSLTGNAANLARGKKLVADVSSYSLSGQSANLRVGRNLTGDVRSYALSTNAANLLEFKRLVADVRTYTLSGQSANLLENSRLVAESRTYTLTRNDATLKVTRRLVADTRSYALTGNNFFFGTAGKITADTRSYTFTGNAANLVRSRILISSSQSYNLVINDAALKSSKRVIADKATYTLTGRTANLLAGERGPSDSRNFILTGNAANLTVTRKLISAVSSYTLTRNDANLKFGRKISLSLSSYVTSGTAANLLANRKIQLVRTFFDTNGYVDSGYTDPNYVSIDIGMRAARKLAAQVTSFNLNGIAVNINRGGFIKVWTGSAWVSKPLKVWDGAAWVSKPLKIWDGTTWRIY